MNFNPACEFLTRCFSPGETVAVLLRRENPTHVTQRIVTLETLLAPRYLAWLGYQNEDGWNLYAAANPLLAGSRKRTKECIQSIRHLYLDIDTDGASRLAGVMASDSVPTPNVILNTSPGKYQVLWRVRGFDFEAQEETLKGLALAFGGDPACTDRNRVLRIPGYLNCKYEMPHLVSAEYITDAVSVPDDFGAAVLSVPNWLLAPQRISPIHATKHSNSESDWAWVSQQLRIGIDPIELTRELATKRCDKPNPLYYAQRTVDVASARQWLANGESIERVVAMLDTRRRSELPLSLCSVRAREIASTAQRMIACPKTTQSTNEGAPQCLS